MPQSRCFNASAIMQVPQSRCFNASAIMQVLQSRCYDPGQFSADRPPACTPPAMSSLTDGPILAHRGQPDIRRSTCGYGVSWRCAHLEQSSWQLWHLPTKLTIVNYKKQSKKKNKQQQQQTNKKKKKKNTHTHTHKTTTTTTTTKQQQYYTRTVGVVNVDRGQVGMIQL